ncbi:exodeoxyribonuclease VII large subunit [Streptococcus caprae]|uniref:Exodeoxyribonuclease 7 large subunit n=1 Tax=Streptococcus caprae TaxID=1640501 RepID=A0ABV8CTP4_9STRE
MSDYLSVSHLTKYLKLKFDRDPYLERVYLTGQVSNFRKRPTHQYFSLKDDKAVIQATMWAGIFKALPFDLEEGMKINVIGRIQLYEPSGTYSIIIEKAEPDGIGALALQFEQLKKKLAEAGYFDQRHKQSLPQFAKKIGVLTSPSGAVIRDIITTVSRRFPGVEILLFPTKVQGAGAAEDVVRNLALANQRDDLDLLIVGRGGGSIEDLWAFNEEIVVQAIFESRLPVISSVGHETDTTLADFVADSRAATPTAAAELATPVTKADLLNFLQDRQLRFYQALMRLVNLRRERLDKITQSVIFRQPARLYDAYVQSLDRLTMNIRHQMEQRLSKAQSDVTRLHASLQAQDMAGQIQRFQDQVAALERLLLSQTKTAFERQQTRFDRAQDALLSLDTSRIISRGYAMVQKDSKIIQSVKDVTVGEEVTVLMQDGQLLVEVKDAK